MSAGRKNRGGSVPPVTLDLKAKDVTPESPSPAGEAPAAPHEPGARVTGAASEETVSAVEQRYGPPRPEPEDKAGPRLESPVPPQSTSPIPPPRESSGAGYVAAALLGGVVGAGLMLALAAAGAVPGLGGQPAEDLSPRFASLSQEVARLRARIDSAGDPARLTGLEQDVVGLRTLSGGNADRLTALEATVKATGDAANDAVTTAAEARNAADTLGQKLAALPSVAPQTTPAVDLTPLEERLGRVETTANAASAAVPPLEQKFAPLAEKVSTVAGSVEAAEQRLATVEKAVAAGPNERTAAYAVALGQIGEALRTGRPFTEALAAAGRIGGEAEALAPLQPLAATGAPTLASLTRDFEGLMPAIREAVAPTTPQLPADAGVFDRLWANAENSGTVSEAGVPDQQALAGTAAGVRVLLRQGDLQGALTAVGAMPEPARAVTTQWVQQAQAMIAARDLVDARIAATLQKLSR